MYAFTCNILHFSILISFSGDKSFYLLILHEKGKDVEEKEKSAPPDDQEAIMVMNRVKIFQLSRSIKTKNSFQH